MAKKWIATRFKGVRFYEHDSRKHGVKKDRYLAIRYQKDGKRVEEGIGWTSDRDPEDGQYWTEEKAALVLERLKGAARHGKRGAPTRLAEKRELEEKRREAERTARERAEREAVTFGQIFRDNYFPAAMVSKTKQSWKAESSLFKTWIEPVIGTRAMKDIAPIHLQRIRKDMEDEGRAARSVNYAFSVIRQVFNFANKNGLYSGEWPGSKRAVPMVKKDNRRMRYLTREEAGALLASLREKSADVHDMTLLSLHCGLRAGEIFNLEWTDIDLEHGTVFLRDTKSGRNRHAYMTNAVKKMLSGRPRDAEKVFPSKGRGRIERISKTFNRTVGELKLNEGVTDPRQKIVFHSCRHTYASWLVEGGTDLFVVKELLGHEQISQTVRYSHLRENHLRNAVRNLEAGMKSKKNVIKLKRAKHGN